MKVNKCPKADRCMHADDCVNHDTFRGEYLCFERYYSEFERQNLQYYTNTSQDFGFARIINGVEVQFKRTNSCYFARCQGLYGHLNWVKISIKAYE